MRKIMDCRWNVKLSVLLLVVLMVPSVAQSQDAELTRRMNRMIAADKTAGRKAVYARWLKGGRIFNHNMDVPMVPASCLKILSSGVVLRHLGESFRFTTTLHGSFEGDSMTTALYWRGDGDPSFTLDNLTAMVRQIRARGVNKIPKGVVLDDTYFDRRTPAGFNAARGHEGYLALPTATAVDGNAITVTHEVRDDAVQVSCFPNSPYHQCSTEVTIGAKEEIRFTTETKDNVLHIRSRGTITEAAPKVVNRVRAFDSARYQHSILVQVLRDNGFTVPDTFARGKVPDKTPVLATHSSATLAHIVRGTNRHSNNYYSENLLKALGARVRGEPGTTQNGLELVYAFLHRAGVRRNQVVLSNGSGLFGNSRIGARSLANAMNQFATLPWLHALLLDSMARPGRDGTLFRRLTGTAAEDVLYAKTGTLNEASCLAGYIQRGNRTILFAIMQDGINGNQRGARALQDELVIAMSRYIKGQKP